MSLSACRSVQLLRLSREATDKQSNTRCVSVTLSATNVLNTLLVVTMTRKIEGVLSAAHHAIRLVQREIMHAIERAGRPSMRTASFIAIGRYRFLVSQAKIGRGRAMTSFSREIIVAIERAGCPI